MNVASVARGFLVILCIDVPWMTHVRLVYLFVACELTPMALSSVSWWLCMSSQKGALLLNMITTEMPLRSHKFVVKDPTKVTWMRGEVLIAN